MQEISFAYPCTLRKDSEGRFVARFPNVPEALTDGTTKEEALAEAVDCLRAVSGSGKSPRIGILRCPLK